MHAFRAGIGPRCALIGRSCEHHERARGIRAEATDEEARLNDVVFALGHLFDAAIDDRLAVLNGGGAERYAAFVEFLMHFRRIEPTLLAVGILAVVTVGQEHALGEQALERLVELHQAQVAHHPGPEPRIQQVQHGVLDSADILIHRHPVVVALIDHGLRIRDSNSACNTRRNRRTYPWCRFPGEPAYRIPGTCRPGSARPC